MVEHVTNSVPNLVVQLNVYNNKYNGTSLRDLPRSGQPLYNGQSPWHELLFFCFCLISLYNTGTRIKTKHISDETKGTDCQLMKTLAAKEIVYSGAFQYTSILLN